MADGKIIIDARISTDQALRAGSTLKKQAESIAKEYRKQGLSMEDAMEKAWKDIEADAKRGAKSTRQTINKEFAGAAADLKQTLSGIGGMLASVFTVQAVISLAKECIELGSAVEEVQNVVDTAFGSMAYKMEIFAETAITTYGISQLAAKKTGSNYMAMARGIGIAEDVASDMAITLTGLSADVASFYNLDQEEAATKLKSVFTGETETLKDLGVVMTQTNLQQYALTKGMKKSISAMNQAELTTLRYNYVLDSLSMASGDFVRTQDSWANQTRILSEQMKQLGANIGTIMTTVLLPAIQSINQIVAGLVSATNAVVRAINALKGNTSQNNSTASSASSAADAEYELADGINAAASAAKKAQAGFDELNILQTNAGGASGGSGGGMGSTSIPSTSVGSSGDVGDISPEMQDFANQIVSLGVTISDVFFEWEDLSGEEIAKKVITGLSAVVGGVAGFFIGGVPGAVKGSLLGVGLGIGLSNVMFDNDGTLDGKEILKMLVATLGTIGGALIGFYVGGPAGAAIGAVIGLGLSFTIVGIFGKSDLSNTKKSVKDHNEWTAKSFSDTGKSISKNFTRAAKHLNLNFMQPTQKKINSVAKWMPETLNDSTDAIVEDFEQAAGDTNSTFEDCANSIVHSFEIAARGTDTGFITPTREEFDSFGEWISDEFEDSAGSIVDNFEQAARQTDTGFIVPTQEELDSFGQWISETFEDSAEDIIDNFERAARQTETGFTIPTQEDFEETGKLITTVFTNAKKGIEQGWKGLCTWFDEKVFTPLETGFKGMINGIIGFLNGMLRAVGNGINSVVRAVNRISITLPNWEALGDMAGDTIGFNLSTVSMPQIPYLAQGAVIPPNREFLAVLGDQSHGTNIEAPLSTIQEAVAIVMEDMIQSNLAGQSAIIEVLRQILEAVLGIELDGETLSRAVENYNRKMAVVNGG